MIVSTSYNQNAFDIIGLQAPRESYEICTDTEAGTLASCDADGGGDKVENREDGGGDERQGGDLIDRQCLPGDKKRGARNNETLDEVFDRTVDNFSNVHSSLYSVKRKFNAESKDKGFTIVKKNGS